MNKHMFRCLGILTVFTLLVGMFDGTKMEVFADSYNVVTLGADLSEEQKNLMFDYFGVDTDNVQVITVTNKEEHELLDDVATKQQIGTHTFSCSYIEPTDEGGIHIKTANLNWVTCDMIRNALVTSGITDCNVVCAAPIEVSGTGALTGIFKAYETVSGEEMDGTKKELASEELVETAELADDIGQDEASTIMNDVKQDVIKDSVTDDDIIKGLVKSAAKTQGVELKDEQIDSLVTFFSKIGACDYNFDAIKSAYDSLDKTAADALESAKETAGFLGKIRDFFSDLWAKINGSYEEKQDAAKEEQKQKSLGILNNVKDDVLGAKAVVTDTDDGASSTEENDTKENKESTPKKHWYDFILTWFNAGNNDTDSDKKETQTEIKREQTPRKKSNSSSQSENSQVKENSQSDKNSLDKAGSQSNSDESSNRNENDKGNLGYVTYDVENANKESTEQGNNNKATQDNSFDSLVQ